MGRLTLLTLQIGAGGDGLSGHQSTGSLGGAGVGASWLHVLHVHDPLLGSGTVPLSGGGLLVVNHSWNEVLTIFSGVRVRV